ncbi:PEGA domain-containing protein [Desulfomarina sp.]
MQTCWKCSKEIPEGSPSCPHCKAPLSRDAVDNMATIGPGGAPDIQIVVGVVVKERYEIQREIGRGGMGIVYLAHDRMMDKQVALKVIPQELCMDPRAVGDLKRETGIAMGLTHENIVRLHTLDTWEGQAFVVMEYVGGGTLAHLQAGVTLGLEEILPVVRQIAKALDYSHSASPAVIHRDLKPLNILLTEDGTPKIADFGLARVMRDSATRISGHDSAGTLAYMAPEQLRGKGIGKATDIYAFAAIIYELLSGNPPFYTGDLRWQIMHEEVEPIAGLPDYVNAALLAGLAKEREDRPQSAGELVGMLTGEKQVVQGRKRQQKKKKKPAGRKQAGRSKYLFAGLGFLLVAALAVGGYYYSFDVGQLVRGGPILSVESEPPGALLFVDDGRVEKTPTAVSDLANGTHTVRLELEKYLVHTEKIFIQQDKPIHLTAKLVPEPFGDLRFESTPAGAEIFIEKKAVGTTPATVEHIDAGNHLIELKKKGFDPWQRKVEVKPLVTGEVVADLVSIYGGLQITSKPAGATVLLDGQKLGKTPYGFSQVLKGQYKLGLQLKKYKPWQKNIEVEASQTVIQHVELDELKQGQVKLSSVPSGARVSVDGKPVGTTPLVVDHLPGRIDVAMTLPMYKPWQKQVKVLAGETVSAHAGLARVTQFKDTVTGMEFTWVKGGCYRMGDTFGGGYSDEKPVHKVCVDGFYIGKYEVTQGEYKKIMGGNPSRFKKGDRYPVERVSWNDAQAFIKKLNNRTGKKYRLPTEAEWEYAARSGGKNEKYAGANRPESVAWFDDNSGSSTHRVGTKSANGLGLYDMSGNVWEWCQDWYDSGYYGKSPENNPGGPSSGSNRVNRGGSWNYAARGVRTANRDRDSPGNRIGNLGFRLVLSGQ